MASAAIVVLALCGRAIADCYSHDGIEAAKSEHYPGAPLVPCGQGSAMCCKFGEKCGSNMLCYNDVDSLISRSYCADRDWGPSCSQACPQFDEAGVVLTDCGDNRFCCGYNSTECCASSADMFSIDPSTGEMGAPVRNSGVVQTWAQPNETPTGFEIVSETSSAVESTTSAVAGTGTESSGVPTSSAATDKGSSTALVSPSEQSGSEGRQSLSGGAIGGIVVGSLAGIGVVIGAVIFLYSHSKRRENSAPVHEVSAYQEHNRFGGTVGDKPNNSHAAELNGPGLHVPAELDSAARHRQYN